MHCFVFYGSDYRGPLRALRALMINLEHMRQNAVEPLVLKLLCSLIRSIATEKKREFLITQWAKFIQTFDFAVCSLQTVSVHQSDKKIKIQRTRNQNKTRLLAVEICFLC